MITNTLMRLRNYVGHFSQSICKHLKKILEKNFSSARKKRKAQEFELSLIYNGHYLLEFNNWLIYDAKYEQWFIDNKLESDDNETCFFS